MAASREQFDFLQKPQTTAENCFHIGIAFMKQKSYHDALRLLCFAAEGGIPEAASIIRKWYRASNNEQEGLTARQIRRQEQEVLPARKKNFPPFPTAKDQITNLYWLAMANKPEAQYDLAIHLLNAGHIKPAIKWLDKAAHNNIKMAAHHLAYCYRYGIEVMQDMQQSSHWLHESIAQLETPHKPITDARIRDTISKQLLTYRKVSSSLNGTKSLLPMFKNWFLRQTPPSSTHPYFQEIFGNLSEQEAKEITAQPINLLESEKEAHPVRLYAAAYLLANGVLPNGIDDPASSISTENVPHIDPSKAEAELDDHFRITHQERITNLLKRAATAGHSAAQLWLGKRLEENYHQKSGHKNDSHIFWYENLCSKNLALPLEQPFYPEALLHLGRCYLYGIGVERTPANQDTGFSLLKRAANQGVAIANYYLGRYYQDGTANIQPDQKRAIYAFAHAAKDGVMIARDALRNILHHALNASSVEQKINNITTLLQQKFPLNLRLDYEGNTAAMIMLAHPLPYETRIQIAQECVSKGANLAARNQHAETAYDTIGLFDKNPPQEWAVREAIRAHQKSSQVATP